jgi:hypothetical protein
LHLNDGRQQKTIKRRVYVCATRAKSCAELVVPNRGESVFTRLGQEFETIDQEPLDVGDTNLESVISGFTVILVVSTNEITESAISTQVPSPSSGVGVVDDHVPPSVPHPTRH